MVKEFTYLNRLKLLLALFLIVSSLCAFSSEKREDSLLQVLQHQKDTGRINTLLDLAWYYNHRSPEKAKQMATTAMEESIAINYETGTEKAHRRLADYYRKKTQYAQAQEHLIEALRIAEKSGDTLASLKTLVGLGNLYFNIDNNNKALLYYEKSLALTEKIDNPKYFAIVCNNLAQAYEYMGDFKTAKQFYFKGLKAESPNNQTQNYLNLIQNIASSCYYLDQTDSAFFYNNMLIEIALSNRDTNTLAGCYLNEGVYIESSGNYQKAIQSYQKGIKLAAQINDLSLTQNLVQNIMLCYGYLGNIDSIDHYFEKNHALNQNLIRLKTDNAIHDISIKYDVEKKEQDLILAQKDNEKAVLENQLQRNTIYILVVVILAIVVVVIIFYLLFKEKQKLVELEVKSKNNEIESMVKQQELNMYKALIEGQETERKRIAEDLHDKLGGLLATINLQFESPNPLSEKTIANVRSLVNESIKSVRSISHNLADGRVDQLGLKKSIIELKDSLTNSGKINFELFLESYTIKWDIEKERELFKVILELVSNTLKHANANTIILQISVIDGKIHVTFEDNGSGFSPNEVTSGLGMKTIIRRVDNLMGNWYVDSKTGHGSTVVIEIPLA